jgi:heptosyltransferase III
MDGMSADPDAAPEADPDAVLVYHAGALGDFVTTVPAFRAWRILHPGKRVAFLGRPAHGALGIAAGLFDEARDAGSPRWASLFTVDPSPSALAAMSPFRAALVFARADSPLPAALAVSGIQEVLRQDPFPPAGGPHVVDFHRALFPPDCLPEEDRVPRLRFPEAVLRGAGNLLPPGPAPTALHPGSGSPRKNWPADRWVGLAQALAAEGERVVWVLGPVEEGCPVPEGAEILRCPDLAALACLFSSCRLFVGNDGGAAHLAAASGCPVVALFGPTDPGLWAPRGGAVTVLRRGKSMDSIDGDEVLDACRRMTRMGGRHGRRDGR